MWEQKYTYRFDVAIKSNLFHNMHSASCSDRIRSGVNVVKTSAFTPDVEGETDKIYRILENSVHYKTQMH